MVAISFMARFAEDVAAGRKRCTMRGREIEPGAKLQLYTGQRTKNCRKLGDAVCQSCEPVAMGDAPALARGYWMKLNGVILGEPEIERLAIEDGFARPDDMIAFFRRKPGLPAAGWLIRW